MSEECRRRRSLSLSCAFHTFATRTVVSTIAKSYICHFGQVISVHAVAGPAGAKDFCWVYAVLHRSSSV